MCAFDGRFGCRSVCMFWRGGGGSAPRPGPAVLCDALSPAWLLVSSLPGGRSASCWGRADFAPCAIVSAAGSELLQRPALLTLQQRSAVLKAGKALRNVGEPDFHRAGAPRFDRRGSNSSAEPLDLVDLLPDRT